MSAALTGRKLSAETRSRISAATTGANHPNWKGGRIVDSQGYILIHSPFHPQQINGYVYEHRLVYEAVHGSVPKSHVVHHKNGDKQDNRPENLEAMPQSDHMKLHRPERYRYATDA